MAAPAQYNSFALIAADAVQLQYNNVLRDRAKGCEVGDDYNVLFLCQNVIETVASYGIGCLDMTGRTETDIVTLCNWLKTTLKFTTGPISSFTGIDPDVHQYDPEDYNSQQFA